MAKRRGRRRHKSAGFRGGHSTTLSGQKFLCYGKRVKVRGGKKRLRGFCRRPKTA